MTKNQSLSLTAFLGILVLVGFQNCSKVGVQDAGALNSGKVGANGLVADQPGSPTLVAGIPDQPVNVQQPPIQDAPPVVDQPPVSSNPPVVQQPPAVDQPPVSADIPAVGQPVPPVSDQPPVASQPPADPPPPSCAAASSLSVKDADLGSVECNSDRGQLCVLICHIPPGNHSKQKTLMFKADSGAPAAHLHHGDKLGACEDMKDEPVCEDADAKEDDHDEVAEVEVHGHKDSVKSIDMAPKESDDKDCEDSKDDDSGKAAVKVASSDKGHGHSEKSK